MFKLKEAERVSGEYARKIEYENLKLVRRLLKNGGKVHEFGKSYNLYDKSDLSELVERTSQFVEGLKIPGTVEATIHLAKAMARPHRRLIWQILAKQGSFKAKILCRAVTKGLKVVHLDEVQGSEVADICAVITMILMMIGLVAAGVCTRLAWTKVQPILTATKPVASTLTVVGKVVKTIQETCKEAYAWAMNILEEIKKTIEDKSYLCPFIEGLFGVILFLMAFYYVREALGKTAKKIKRFLSTMFGVTLSGDEVQGWSDDPLCELLDLIRMNCTKIEKTTFWKMAWKLPRLTSMAKAIEYVCVHARKIFAWIRECITGKIHPYGPQEDAIVAHNEVVSKLGFVIDRADAKEILDPLMDAEINACVLEKDRINNQLIKEKSPPRPYFTGMLTQANVKLQQIRLDYSRYMHMSRERPVPVVVYIKGAKGVGKSTVVEIMTPMVWEYLRKMKLVPDRAYTAGDSFKMNQKEDFWDGFMSQVFLEVDDLFQQTSAEIRSNVADNIIHMCSPSALQLRMADPKAKGHTYFECKVIFITTNLMSEDFAAENLGMVEPGAFADRRTIVVEMMGEDDFRFEKCTRVNNMDRCDLNTLVAIIGECVKIRDDMKTVPRRPAPPRQFFKFESPRLKFDNGDKVQCEDVPSARDLINTTIIAMKVCVTAYMEIDESIRDEEMESLIREFWALCNEFYERGDDPDWQIWFMGLVRQMDHYIIPVLSLKIADDGSIMCLHRPSVLKLPSEHVNEYCMRQYIKDVASNMYENVREEMNEHWPDEVQSKEGEDMTGLEKGKEKETEEERAGRILRMKRMGKGSFDPKMHPCNLNMVELREGREKVYPWYTSDNDYKSCKTKTEWAQEWKKYNKYDPEKQRMFPIPKQYKEIVTDFDYYECFGGAAQAAASNLAHIYQPCKDIEYWYTLPKQEGVSLEQDFHVYWRDNMDRDWERQKFYESHARALDDDSVRAIFKYVGERLNHFNWWCRAVAGFCAYLLVVNMIARMFMPAAAHADVAQGMYDGNTTHRQVRSHKAARAPSRHAAIRALARNIKEEAGVQSEDSHVHKKIAENYERIAMLEVPKGTRPEEVKSIARSSSCWILFVGGEYALVPGHIMFGKAKDEIHYDYWVALCRNNDTMFRFREVEVVKPLAGDILLCRFPNVAPRKMIVQHFAHEMPQAGFLEQLKPILGHVGMRIRSVHAFEERIHTIPYATHDYDVSRLDFRRSPK